MDPDRPPCGTTFSETPFEILPVSVKFLLNLGDETAYDVAARLKNDESNDRQQIRRAERRTLEEHASQDRIAAADAQRVVDADMRGREVELGKRANEYVADHMQDILGAALLEWSNRRPISLLDFATALASARAVLQTDYQRAVREAPLTAPPVLVIYAAAAPLADAITSARYAALAEKVPVLWILPGDSAHLLSAVFRDGKHVHVSTNHPAIATELVTLIAEQTQARRSAESDE